MEELQHLFDSNREWVKEITASDPDFFKRLAKQQKPELLWIGCSDSRVPTNQIVNRLPGEVFVHRNIANQAVAEDVNCQAVIQFAVEVLKVRHIIVCGHYGCGGIIATLEGEGNGKLADWLAHIRAVYLDHQSEVDMIENEQEKINRLCELNVASQVEQLCRSAPVIAAWQAGQPLKVHGLIYNIEDGILKDLNITVTGSG